MNTTLTNDLCNEVRDLREQLAVVKADMNWARQSCARYISLLIAVLDAGRPHPREDCICLRCEAWRAVRKELRGE